MNEKGKTQNESVRNKADDRALSAESRTELVKKLDNLEDLVANQKMDLKELERQQAENKPTYGVAGLIIGAALLYSVFFGSPIALLIGLGGIILNIVGRIIWFSVTSHYDEKAKKAEAELIQTQAEIKKLQTRLYSEAR